jgi:hypothetical protein
MGGRNRILIVQKLLANLSAPYINWNWVTYPFLKREYLISPQGRLTQW